MRDGRRLRRQSCAAAGAILRPGGTKPAECHRRPLLMPHSTARSIRYGTQGGVQDAAAARQQPALRAARQAQHPRCARVWHLTVALHEAGWRLPGSPAPAAPARRGAGVWQHLGCAPGVQGGAAAWSSAFRCVGPALRAFHAPSAYRPQPPAPHAAAAVGRAGEGGMWVAWQPGECYC